MFKSVKIACAGTAVAASIIVAAPAHAAVNVGSTVKITGYNYDAETTKVTFKGKVVSNKPFCEANRSITLKQVDEGIVAGRTTSTSTGTWKVRFDGDEIPPGTFKAIMAKKTVKKNGKTFVCAADTHTYNAG